MLSNVAFLVLLVLLLVDIAIIACDKYYKPLPFWVFVSDKVRDHLTFPVVMLFSFVLGVVFVDFYLFHQSILNQYEPEMAFYGFTFGFLAWYALFKYSGAVVDKINALYINFMSLSVNGLSDD